MPVVTVAPNDALLEKLKSNMQEVRARGGVLYVLAVLSNRAEWSSDEMPWVDEFRELVEPHRTAAGDLPSGGDVWKEALAASGRFSALTSSSFDHVQEIAPEAFVAQVSSWSWIANLDEETRGEVLRRVGEMVAGEARVRLRYATELHWARCRV